MTALDQRTPRSKARNDSSRLYPLLLGDAWAALDPVVQWVHTAPAAMHAVGTFEVIRAPGRLMGRLLDIVKAPRAASGAEVRLAVHHRGRVERWQRAFGGLPLVTHQGEAPGGLLAERVGPFEFRFRLAVRHGALVFRQVGFAVRLGPLRLPLPGWCSIRIAAREAGAGGDNGACGRTTVDVRVTGPSGELLFAYRGTVRWTPGGIQA